MTPQVHPSHVWDSEVMLLIPKPSGTVKRRGSRPLALKRGCPLPWKNALKARAIFLRDSLATAKEYSFSQGRSPLFRNLVNSLAREKKLTDGLGLVGSVLLMQLVSLLVLSQEAVPGKPASPCQAREPTGLGCRTG